MCFKKKSFKIQTRLQNTDSKTNKKNGCTEAVRKLVIGKIDNLEWSHKEELHIFKAQMRLWLIFVKYSNSYLRNQCIKALYEIKLKVCMCVCVYAFM